MTPQRIHFATDSTCDIPAELREKHHITLIPTFVNYQSNSYADDGVELKRDEYYNDLPHIRPLPTTAAPSPGLCERLIHEALESADHLVIMTCPAKLSGTFNAMRLAASSLPPERVTLIDSEQVTMGFGWQAILGAEVAEQTGDIEQVKKAIVAVRKNVRVYAALNTLEYLRHSGRVGWAAAGIGQLLQIKPMLEVRDSEVLQLTRVRTFGKAMDELVRLAHEAAPLDRLAFLHTNNLEGVEALKERLKDILPPETLNINITPTIGTYTGPGALGISPVSKKWKDEM
jgi:fatty acid kinase fatty acid binding subunit